MNRPLIAALALALSTTGCSSPPTELDSVQVVDADIYAESFSMELLFGGSGSGQSAELQFEDTEGYIYECPIKLRGPELGIQGGINYFEADAWILIPEGLTADGLFGRYRGWGADIGVILSYTRFEGTNSDGARLHVDNLGLGLQLGVEVGWISVLQTDPCIIIDYRPPDYDPYDTGL